jgi:tRNA pseudouridine55 synthase
MDGIILINKPQSMTSHDVVQIARKALHTKQIGHTGTLDPNATGLLVLLVGKACKCLPYMEHNRKCYEAEMQLGWQTDTLDIWGTTIDVRTPKEYTIEDFIKAGNRFKGSIEQLPPMISSIKVDGRKLYEYARSDTPVTVPMRLVTIESINFHSWANQRLHFTVECSSGTYIRSLCRDIASELGELGVMSSLIRHRIGDLTLDQANTIDDLRSGEINILPIEQGLREYPFFEYPVVSDIYNGRTINLPLNDQLVMITNNGSIIAVYQHISNGLYKSQRGLW